MTLLQGLCAGMLLLGLAGAARAQTAAPTAPAAPSAPKEAAASAAPGKAATAAPARAALPAPAYAASAPKGDALTPTLTVIEDDNVRIEEKRLRGEAQRITVQSKVQGAKPYEIIVGPGRDPSQDRGAVGQSAWSLFEF